MPAAVNTASMFLITCLVCASKPVTTIPSSGLIPIWPDANKKPPLTFAWDYGPNAAGALSV